MDSPIPPEHFSFLFLCGFATYNLPKWIVFGVKTINLVDYAETGYDLKKKKMC